MRGQSWGRLWRKAQKETKIEEGVTGKRAWLGESEQPEFRKTRAST